MIPAKLVAVAITSVALGSQPAPKHYYLALGDSIAYGIQPAKVTAGLPPAGFKSGYVDDFAKRLRMLSPTLRVVNYSCPGESTRTFISGLCPWTVNAQKLHDPYTGAQLRAALTFLHAHPGQVSPITITLWGNDENELSDACNGSYKCVAARAPQAIRAFASRYASILGRLRAAAPSALILVTGAWNADGKQRDDALYRTLDMTMKSVALRAKARYVELFSTFRPICRRTFVCSAGDGHPTDAGYRAIADAVWKATGY